MRREQIRGAEEERENGEYVREEGKGRMVLSGCTDTYRQSLCRGKMGTDSESSLAAVQPNGDS